MRKTILSLALLGVSTTQCSCLVSGSLTAAGKAVAGVSEAAGVSLGFVGDGQRIGGPITIRKWRQEAQVVDRNGRYPDCANAKN